jgi:hypothetical protein
MTQNEALDIIEKTINTMSRKAEIDKIQAQINLIYSFDYKRNNIYNSITGKLALLERQLEELNTL